MTILKKLCALAAAAGLLVAACSSSHAPSFNPGVCALTSACAETFFGSDSSFASECEMLFALQQLESTGTTDTLDRYYIALLECFQAAADCSAIQACFQATAAETAACNGSLGPRCEGDLLVGCGEPPASVENCAAAGQVCVQTATSAGCGTAACDPGAAPSCSGDVLVSCSDGVLQKTDCGLFFGGTNTCSIVGGMAQCAGTGATCDVSTFKSACDGSALTVCIGGKTASLDCSDYGPELTCRVSSDGGAACSSGDECDSTTSESCSGSVITYCMLGIVTTLDCAQYGLSGCTTTSSESTPSVTQTIARCTP